jgi:hypothetical protein
MDKAHALDTCARVCYYHKSRCNSTGFPLAIHADDTAENFEYSQLYFGSAACVKEYLIETQQFQLLEVHGLHCRRRGELYPVPGQCAKDKSRTVCAFHGPSTAPVEVELQHCGGTNWFCDVHCAKSFLFYSGQFNRLAQLETAGSQPHLPSTVLLRPNNHTLTHFRCDGAGYSEAEFLSTKFSNLDHAVSGVLFNSTSRTVPTSFKQVVSEPAAGPRTADVLTAVSFGQNEAGFTTEYL